MIPTSILIALYLFIVVYGVGLISAIGLLINSIRNKDRFIMFISLILSIMYIVFGGMLI